MADDTRLERERFLRKLEDRLSRVSGWLADRERSGEQTADRDLVPRLEKLRREISGAREAFAEKAREDLARATATVDDMARDFPDPDVPPTPATPRRDEVEALQRHLHRTARLIHHVSNLDDPDWGPAHEEYERSWDDLMRAFEEGDTHSHPPPGGP
jgi:hypothetical protein